eukprot:scaffold1301_cov128-Cylindrotheca_fusiformis.AAC.1
MDKETLKGDTILWCSTLTQLINRSHGVQTLVTEGLADGTTRACYCQLLANSSPLTAETAMGTFDSFAQHLILLVTRVGGGSISIAVVSGSIAIRQNGSLHYFKRYQLSCLEHGNCVDIHYGREHGQGVSRKTGAKFVL